MARPKKEGMDYFPHDTDAVNDEKIEALRMLYGNDGYAFYFIMLERIYRTKEFALDVSDAETIQILSRKVGVNQEVFLQMLETSLKRNIFDRELYENHRVLTSPGIQKRSGIVVEKREKMRSKYRNDKVSKVSDAETTQETREETPQSKVKESKVKESKVKKNIYAEFVSMTEDEYKKLVHEHGEEKVKEMIRVLDNYKGSKGKTYKSDYRAILTWVVDRVVKQNGGKTNGTNENRRYSNEYELPF